MKNVEVEWVLLFNIPKLSLCARPVDYIHSSAKQYIKGEKVGYIVDDL
ncbi:hypothetical protein BH09BAC2_BH09BAC2_11790 [soil metagenome]